MINASNAWKDIQYRFLLPETFLEIAVGIGDVEVQALLTATGENEAVISDPGTVVGNATQQKPRYATLEHNLWSLDGSMAILPDSSLEESAGYVSDNGLQARLTLSLDEVRTRPAPGLSIVWSSEYDEYPKAFSVIIKNGDTEVATTYVGDNTSSMSEVGLEFSNYDTVIIEPYEWCLPDHRCRIDRISFGHMISFTKREVMAYSHDQYGDLNSAELPKNSISFNLDNSDGRWNPSNPSGLERYLSERQPVTVRYGMDVDGTVEWIEAGTFYLSEWNTPSNGLEASFTARDIFEYLLNEPYTGITSGTLLEIAVAALGSVALPDTFEYSFSDVLSDYSITVEGSYTCAEVLQMVANAAGCVMYQDRLGVLHVEPLNKAHSGYGITAALSYTHPELSLSKPIKSVSVAYGEETYTLAVTSSGETQTVTNPFIGTLGQAEAVAEAVKATYETRKSVKGEYRADPRLDVFDIVSVESKYGGIFPVAITDIKYDFTGSFKASYAGRVLSAEGFGTSQVGSFIIGESVLGEVV